MRVTSLKVCLSRSFSLLEIRVPFCSCSGSPYLGPGFLASLTCGPSLHTRVVPSRCVPEPLVFLPPLPCGVFPTASVDKAPRGANWWRRNMCRVRLWFHKAGEEG